MAGTTPPRGIPRPPDPPFPPPAPPPRVPGPDRAAPEGRPTLGRYVAAIAAAVGVQIAAVLVAMFAVTVLLLAAFSTFGTSDTMPAWGLLSIPIGLAAVAIWIWSGALAARISGSPRAWAVLMVLPTAVVVVRILSST